jgi:arylsulfatase A-like enzyme
MALTIDLAPTFLDLAGLAPGPDIDGRSLVPVLKGRVADWRRSFLIEYTSDTVFPRIDRMGYDAVRTERYKYVRFRELVGMDEVYDLDQDPYELQNLMGAPQGPAFRAELVRELDRLQRR